MNAWRRPASSVIGSSSDSISDLINSSVDIDSAALRQLELEARTRGPVGPSLPASGAERSSLNVSTPPFTRTRAHRIGCHDAVRVADRAARARMSVARRRVLSRPVSGPVSSKPRPSRRIPRSNSRRRARGWPCARRPNCLTSDTLHPIVSTLGRSSKSRPCSSRESATRSPSAVTPPRPRRPLDVAAETNPAAIDVHTVEEAISRGGAAVDAVGRKLVHRVGSSQRRRSRNLHVAECVPHHTPRRGQLGPGAATAPVAGEDADLVVHASEVAQDHRAHVSSRRSQLRQRRPLHEIQRPRRRVVVAAARHLELARLELDGPREGPAAVRVAHERVVQVLRIDGHFVDESPDPSIHADTGTPHLQGVVHQPPRAWCHRPVGKTSPVELDIAPWCNLEPRVLGLWGLGGLRVRGSRSLRTTTGLRAPRGTV